MKTSKYRSQVNTAGPEKESSQNRAGGISEGKCPRNLRPRGQKMYTESICKRVNHGSLVPSGRPTSAVKPNCTL